MNWSCMPAATRLVVIQHHLLQLLAQHMSTKMSHCAIGLPAPFSAFVEVALTHAEGMLLMLRSINVTSG